MKLSEGVLESPNYPDYYRPSKDCIWKIAVEEGHKVAFEFTAFEVGPPGVVGRTSRRLGGVCIFPVLWISLDWQRFV